MRIYPSEKCRSYVSQTKLGDAVAKLLGDFERQIPWVAMTTTDNRWTAVIFLPSNLSQHAFQIASFGFKVCA